MCVRVCACMCVCMCVRACVHACVCVYQEEIGHLLRTDEKETWLGKWGEIMEGPKSQKEVWTLDQ